MHRYPATRIRALRNLAPFAGCTKRQLVRIDGLMTTVTKRSGCVLAREGAVGRECFLVQSGAIAVSRDGTMIDQLGPGSWAGEVAPLTDGFRTATLTTADDTVLLVFNRREFATVLAYFPTVAASIRETARTRAARSTTSRRTPASVTEPSFAVA